MTLSPDISRFLPLVFDNHTSSKTPETPFTKTTDHMPCDGTASSAPRDLVTKWETETEAEMRLQDLSPLYR